MKLIFTACAFFVLVTHVSGQSDDAKWVEFPAGLSYVLYEENSQLSVRIPINRLKATTDLADLVAKRRDVFSVAGRPNSLAQSLTLTWAVGTQDVGPSLVVEAKTPALRPGNYTLVVDIEPKEATAGQRPQSATFTLERPSPKLVALRSVNIWQERRWPLVTKSTAGKLSLYEESHKAAARTISFNDVRTPPSLPGPETGKLHVTLDPIPIVHAGADVAVDVEPVGNFPLGKTTGKLRVNSPQLAAPLIVDYEVVATRTPLLIAICAAIGALFGWLSRVFLQSRREWINAKINASEALALLIRAQQTIPDALFKKAVADAAFDLKEAIAKLKTETVTNAIAQATKALADAQSDLNARRKILSDALVPLHRKLHQGWKLPPQAENVLATARTLADGVLALADAQNIKAASDKLNNEMPNLRLALAKAASEWRADAKDYLREFIKHLPALKDQGPERMAEAVAAWDKQFGDARIPVSVDDDALELELSNTHGAFAQALRIMKDAKDGTIEVTDWVLTLFPGAADKTLFEELQAIARKHGSAAEADLAHPEKHRGAPAKRQLVEREAWRKALCSVLPHGADTAIVTTELDAGRWIAAAQAAKDSHSQSVAKNLGPKTRGGTESQIQPAGVDSPSAPKASGVPFHISPVIGTRSTADSIRAAQELTGSRTERMELAREEKWISFAQSAILSCVFIALAYGFYGSQWIGTFREMLGVFAWAFGLDLTVDSLSPMIKKFGTTPTPT